MTKINAKTFTFPAYIAIGTMVNLLLLIVFIKVANGAKILRKWNTIRITIGVDTFWPGGLERSAFHAQDFFDRMPI